MRRRIFVALICLAAGLWLWMRLQDDAAKRSKPYPAANTAKPTVAAASNATTPNAAAAGQLALGQHAGAAAPNPSPVAVPSPDQVPYRLSNTDQALDQLGRSDSAILLENALIDTASPKPLAVPEHLRASGDPGSYLVQSARPLDKAFYARLREAGAEFVSYIPNNAALVRVSADGARLLAAMPATRTVLPYEPYYKVARALLPLAVEQQSMPLDQLLHVVLFAGERDNTLPALRNLGAEPMAEEAVPSGLMLTVQAHPDSLVALAQLPGVQRIEVAHARVLLNDLFRSRLNVSADTVAPTNYLDLTGTNVTLNLNDTGVWQDHPDLKPRVFFSSTDTNMSTTNQDPDGHGTHVAGTIISSGASATFPTPSGSVPGASFRGMAPAASLFVLPIDLNVGPLVSDTYLQQTAATSNFIGLGRTNTMISNNSWAYNGAFEYNSASASYDAAVRDALPGTTGPQPVLYVFAAGNSGRGNDDGTEGDSDSVPAPATAKNVITVGAIEQLRNITNVYYTTNVVTGTNMVITNSFLGFTDSDNVVASFSSRGNVGIGIEGFGRVKPDVVAPGAFVVSTRSRFWLLDNSLPPSDPRYPVLSSLNSSLAPYYRYETGTSMAAGGVSGVLALMQEFFEQRLKLGFSPALAKALLISGARSVNPNVPKYDFCVTNSVKIQGWGLVNLTNSLPVALTNTDQQSWPLRFFDQSPTRTLATGQRHTWELGLSAEAQGVPLRVTLVWTDPPGNPSAGIKLVNDLDLVMTNLDTGDVFVGNGIPTGFDFNPPTNGPPRFDFVNNVENVILQPPLGTNYVITVVGRRVNVNAVTANTNDVVQDYALVVSSGDGEFTAPFTSLTGPTADLIAPPPIIALTNGAQVLRQRVGANFQLAPLPDGEAEQWRFYVFTNFFSTNSTSGLINGSNVAFITFPDGDLSLPRNLEPDIDLYVSTDPALTNLNAAVITNAFKSLNRGGTEAVVFTNAPVGPDKIFYIGVKSEDQQAAEFGIVGFSSDQPFAEHDPHGNHILRGLPQSVAIPDGSPDAPGGERIFAVDTELPVTIARVIVTTDIAHQSMGDLLGNLSYASHFAVLNNHNRYGGVTNIHLVFDDSNSGEFLLSRPTDAPGSLNNFAGEQTGSTMPWILTMVDNTHGRTGRVENLSIRVEPSPTIVGTDVRGSVLANQWAFYIVDVPVDASKLTVTLSQMNAPLNLYLKRGAPPTANDFDKSALIIPPGGFLSIGLDDAPPLNAGRYFIGVFNPNSFTVDYTIRADLQLSPTAAARGNFLSADTPTFVVDDAIMRSSIFVPVARDVASVQVGVRIDHARASDLVLHLVSPLGTRVLLAENRGRTNTHGYGVSELLSTNTVIVFTNSFENAVPTNYFAGAVADGWRVVDNVVSVRADRTLAADGTNMLVLRGGRVSRLLPTTAGWTYRLNFSYRLNPGVPRGIVSWWPGVGGTATDIVSGYTGNMSDVAIVPGMVGEGFGFNGTTSAFSVLDSPVLHFTSDYTLEFWVNPDPAQNPFASLLRKEYPASPGGFGIEMDGATNSNFYYAGWKSAGSAPGDVCWTTAGFQLTPGVWQHVAVVKSNTTRFVYINGAPIGSATCVGNTNAVAFNSAQLQFGTWFGRTNSGWKGILDEMAIYNRALSPTEIEDIVVSGAAGKCGNIIPPLICSSGAEVLLDDASVAVAAPATFSWATKSIQFTATKNGTTLDLAPIGAGMLLDKFVLIENRVAIRPDYTVFTENTNLASVPIKFAAPPFTNSPMVTSLTNNLVLDDGFENAANGLYSAGQLVSGWQVSTGQVTVFGVPNPLGLSNSPNGFPPHVPGKKFLALNGEWSSTDRDGVITNWAPGGVVTNFNTTAGGQYLLSFLTARDPSTRSNLPYPPNPPVVLVLTNGVLMTDISVASAAWQTNLFNFQPANPVTTLEFRSLTTNGVLLDMVQVTALDGGREAYLLPEESLEPFIGEPAYGPWTLEVWDNRAGASTAPPLVLSWKLDLVFANKNPPAIPLTFVPATTNVASVYDTNGVPVTNIVAGDAIRYFIVNVPRRATVATNILSGTGDLVLSYNTNALPTGLSPGDYLVNSNLANLGETLLLTTNSPAGFEMRPGQRYYLGVANVNPGQTNAFTISVAFDQTDTSLISLLALTNGICYTNTIAVTNALDYYQFTVSTNARSVTFDVLPENGNVGLVVSLARAVLDPLPSPSGGDFDYLSDNPGTNTEHILITDQSVPVPLQPGLWYLGVYNEDTNAVTYSICVNESTNITALVNIIPLTNGVPLNYLIGAGSELTNFFRFTIDQTNSAVLFELYALNAQATLLADYRAYPTPSTALFAGPASPAQPGQIVVRTNDLYTSLNADWYLAVDNLQNTNLTFTIRAVVSTNGILPSGLPLDIAIGFAPPPDVGLQFTWYTVVGEKYVIETSDDLVNWTLLDTIVAYSSSTTYIDPTGGILTYLFYRIRQVP